MKNYALWDGQASSQGVAVMVPAQLPPAPAGSEWIALEGDHADFTLALVDGSITEVPRSIPIDVQRAARWEEAKAWRDDRVAAGCLVDGLGRIDSGEDSRSRVASFTATAVAMRSAGRDWSVQWTMQDNRVLPVTADQMIAMNEAITGFLSACQAAGTTIRAQIDAANDTAALAAIDITAGYPN